METSGGRARSTVQSGRIRNIGHYVLGRTIGQGTFGKVKLGTHILTGEKVAVKILEKDKIADAADMERVSREIHILKLIRHPHIVQLYEVLSTQIIETSKVLYLIMEFCSGGELFDYIVAHTRIKEREACRFYHQLLSGVEYLHRLGIVHRDLKPENLLLDHNRGLKIVDFGLSNTYKPGETLKTACGSPCYAAPEMVAGKRYYGLRVDVWSSGVILYAMVCGFLPFEDANTAQLYKKIKGGEYTCPHFLTGEAKDLIQRVLNVDPETRFSIDDIRKHAWYRLVREDPVPGLVVGVHKLPINFPVLQRLSEFSLDPVAAQKSLEDNRHNHVTTTYYLLLKKSIREEQPIASPALGSSETGLERRDGSTGGSGAKEQPVSKVPESPSPPPKLRDTVPTRLPIFRPPSAKIRIGIKSLSPGPEPAQPQFRLVPREPSGPKAVRVSPRPPSRSVATARGGVRVIRLRTYREESPEVQNLNSSLNASIRPIPHFDILNGSMRAGETRRNNRVRGLLYETK